MELEGPDLLLMHATKCSNYDAMKDVLKAGPSSPAFANVDAFDGEDTPLSAAMQHNDYEAMRILLAAEANPNINLESGDRYDQGDGATPLMFAVLNPDAFALILVHTRFEPDLGRRTRKGKALVDCIPDNLRTEIYTLLALYYGDDKQTAELYAKANAAGAPVAKPKPKPRKKAPKAK